MELIGTRDINAAPQAVWTAILDPEVLKACIPGCESMAGSPEAGYEAVVVQKVGPVKARFTGIVNLSDITPGQAVTISGEGKGGAAGFAKGGAKVTLEPFGTGTRLTYKAEANVGGKLAQLGSRIIEGFAKKMADDFFGRFQATVEGPDAGPLVAPASAPEAVAAAAPAAAAPKKKGWLRRLFG